MIPARLAASAGLLPLAFCMSPGCYGRCPEPPPLPTPATYEIVEARLHPELLGALVTVAGETVVIEYEQDGFPVRVTYTVGDRY